jgi:GT2 family glycosyltransferase
MPKISIIIPCYNQAIFFKDMLDSIKAQTYQDLETIIVDCVCIDNSIEIAKQNGFTNIVTMSENRGVTGGDNAGFGVAKGKYLLATSQDDIFDKTYFERTSKILDENPKIGIVNTDMMLFGNQSEISSPNRRWNLKWIVNNNQLCGPSLFRKEIYDKLGGWDEKADVAADWDWAIRVCKDGWELGIINEPLYQYRCHSDQITTSYTRQQWHELRGYIRNKYK